MSDDDLSPRPADAVAFLSAIKPESPWCLCAIHPEGQRRFEAAAFLPTQEQEARAFIQSRNTAGMNIYFSLADPKRVPAGKLKKEDMRSSTLIWVDLDPSGAGDLAEQRQQMLKCLDQAVPRPSMIVDSGRGYWGLYQLDMAVEFDGPDGPKTGLSLRGDPV